MSLLTVASAANRVIESALSVVYRRTVVYGTWAGLSYGGDVLATYSMMHERHRVARKSYRYVGLTYAAATAKARELVSLYTRQSKISVWDPYTPDAHGDGKWVYRSGGTEVTAEVAAVHESGSMWSVTVNVSEDDVRITKIDDSTSDALLFAAERQRGYDGESEEA